MRNNIPVGVKKNCVEMQKQGFTLKKIYDTYFKKQFEAPTSYDTFKRCLLRWKTKTFPDDTTLVCGTYEGFVAHDATVQVSANGEIVQAWIKQKAESVDPNEFIEALKDNVEHYVYKEKVFENPERMLEIPLFDMHWGLVFMDYYEPVLNEILGLIHSHDWEKIVIPFGQDFFHNDSIVNGQTTKGTVIEKVDMTKAVKDGRKFIYAIIDAAIEHSRDVRVIYSSGNHDRSISWMFMQTLLERYGDSVVDDTLDYRKVVTYGKNAIMITHGDSKRAKPKDLAHIFPITFPNEFGIANVREIHAGHLHSESDSDIYGVMVRRLSSGGPTSDWCDKEDFIGSHKRFMLFEWDLNKLKTIYYV